MKMKIGSYELTFDEKVIEHRTFECPDYYGVSFQVEGHVIDAFHNVHMGERLNLYATDYSYSKDIPFHSGTAYLLPTGVEFKKLDPNAR